MKISKFLLYTSASFATVAYFIAQATMRHKQFFPTVLALTSSKSFLVVFANGALALLLAFGAVLMKLFFSPIHVVEKQKISDKFYYNLIETGIALSYMRNSLNTFSSTAFCICMASKVFHNLAVARQETMEQQLVPVTKLKTFRLGLFLFLAFNFDVAASIYYTNVVLTEGFGIYVLLLLDSLQMMLSCTGTLLKLLLHQIEVYRHSLWDAKATLKFYVDIVVELTSCVLYICFFVAMCHNSMVPLYLIREVIVNVKKCLGLLGDFMFYRNRVKSLDKLQDPTQEQLDVDPQCSICYGDMIDGAKRLPCGHCFHKACLCRWLERNKTCPYCLQNIDTLLARQDGEAQPEVQNQQQEPQPAPVVQDQDGDDALRQAIEDQIIKTLYEQYKAENSTATATARATTAENAPVSDSGEASSDPRTAAYERYRRAIRQAEEQLDRDLQRL